MPRIDAILFTHAHADHVLGIDDVRILNRLIGRPLEAWMTSRTFAELQLRFEYAFKPWTGPHFFRPALVAREVEAGQSIDVAGLRVKVFEQGPWLSTHARPTHRAVCVFDRCCNSGR